MALISGWNKNKNKLESHDTGNGLHPVVGMNDQLTVSLWSILQTERQCEGGIVFEELSRERVPP